MQEIIFYPKYMIRHSWDVLSISLLLALALGYSILKVGLTVSNIIGIGFLLSFMIFFSRLYFRRIIFSSSYFLVERYVWSSMKIDYSDVIDMGTTKVKTRRGAISFAAISNFAELQSLFLQLLRQGTIDIEQFENKALNEEVALHKSFLPTILAAAILGVSFLLYWLDHQSEFTLIGIWIVFGSLVLVIFWIIYLINKKRTKIQ
jgi:hypothetical protein